MFLIPLLIAAALLMLGAGIALYILEIKYLPQIGISLYELHVTLEQYETLLSDFEVCVWVYLGAVGTALLVSIGFTSFLLTRRLFQHIEEPLDTLVAGVERIQAGDLDSPIAYENADEFKAPCDAVDMMAARLKSSLEEEQRRQQSRKELIAGMSHDLKSPLTSIRAYTEALRDGVVATPEAQRRYMDIICAKEAEMEAMVGRLFEFSKLELSECPLSMETVDLKAEVEAAAADVNPGEAELDASDMEPAAVLADREQLKRILENVIGNSIKYGGRDKVRIKISSIAEDRDVTLTLEDDGVGVPDELLPKIFDVFFRADPSRNRSAAGSGLGLAIVKRSVEQMNGSVRAERSAMGGLSIIIKLRRSETNG